MKKYVDFRIKNNNRLYPANMFLEPSKIESFNTHALKNIIKTIYLCCSLNIPLRGKIDSGKVEVLKSKLYNTTKGNFKGILGLIAGSDQEFQTFLSEAHKNAQMTSPQIQNKIINLLTENVIYKLKKEINSAICWGFSFDETPDKSKREQISFIVRYVNKNLEVNEFFFRIYRCISRFRIRSFGSKNALKIILKIVKNLELD